MAYWGQFMAADYFGSGFITNGSETAAIGYDWIVWVRRTGRR